MIRLFVRHCFQISKLFFILYFIGDEIPLEVSIIQIYSYGFVIAWVPFNTSDMDHRKFLGYQVKVILFFILKSKTNNL